MIQIDKVKIEEKQTLRNLMQLYKYDFTAYDPEDVDAFGLYDYPYLDHYFVEADRMAYFIRVNGVLAGFALLRTIVLADNNVTATEMVEYFVLKKYRRMKIGSQAAIDLFGKYKGYWKVAVLENNHSALLFWSTVIGQLTANNFQERREEGWEGTVLVFKQD